MKRWEAGKDASTASDKVFGIGSSFRVEWCTAGRV